MYVNPGRLTAIAGLLCLAAAAAAQAGSPSSGTISPSHATLTTRRARLRPTTTRRPWAGSRRRAWETSCRATNTR
jgi:hypothetical protein